MKKSLDKASDTGVTLNAAILFSIYFSFEGKSLTNKPKVLKYKASVWKGFSYYDCRAKEYYELPSMKNCFWHFPNPLIDLFSGRSFAVFRQGTMVYKQSFRNQFSNFQWIPAN